MTSKSTDLVIVKFDYKPTDIHELAIQKGERLTLLDDTQHWWRVMNAQGATGYVPSNYVKRSKQVSSLPFFGIHFSRALLRAYFPVFGTH